MSTFLFSLGLFLAAFFIGYKCGKASMVNKSVNYDYAPEEKVDSTTVTVAKNQSFSAGDMLVIENPPKTKKTLSKDHKKKLSKVAKSRKRVNGRFV